MVFLNAGIRNLVQKIISPGQEQDQGLGPVFSRSVPKIPKFLNIIFLCKIVIIFIFYLFFFAFSSLEYKQFNILIRSTGIFYILIFYFDFFGFFRFFRSTIRTIISQRAGAARSSAAERASAAKRPARAQSLSERASAAKRPARAQPLSERSYSSQEQQPFALFSILFNYFFFNFLVGSDSLPHRDTENRYFLFYASLTIFLSIFWLLQKIRSKFGTP